MLTILLNGATARCKDQYRNKKYTKRRCKITQIPKDIPQEATELDLYSNQIKDIPSGTFKNLWSLEDLDLRFNTIEDIDPETFLPLQQCTGLWLSNNQLTCLRAGTFKGLVSLDVLDLFSNQISFIEDGTFSHLPLIRILYLNKNNLVTPMDEKDLIQSQNPFLFLDENPLQCDSRMCWIKDAERDGRVKLRGRWDHTPQCKNYPGVHWDNIKLTCDASGKYNDIILNVFRYFFYSIN